MASRYNYKRTVVCGLLLPPASPSSAAPSTASSPPADTAVARSRSRALSPPTAHRSVSSMKRLLRRLSRVAAADACAAAAAYEPLRPDAAAPGKAAALAAGARRLGGGARVPEGHVPVCVGEEGGPVERYAVRAELLGRPAFAALLRRAAQEYGYGHPGALRIPCPVADFRDLLLQLSSACAAADHPDDDAAALCYYS
jgi:SAUR family protein